MRFGEGVIKTNTGCSGRSLALARIFGEVAHLQAPEAPPSFEYNSVLTRAPESEMKPRKCRG